MDNVAHSILDVLSLARRVADYAESVGFAGAAPVRRAQTHHLGALLADCALQAGLNYRTVVKPRVERIIKLYPESATLSGTRMIIEANAVSDFLMWKHEEKIKRFKRLCFVLCDHNIEDSDALKLWLKRTECRDALLEIHGIGPKTVDYLCCLVGIDCVAVDRHIRAFAKRAGLDVSDYETLQSVFCYAADLLNSSRRGFDSWVWLQASKKLAPTGQYELL